MPSYSSLIVRDGSLIDSAPGRHHGEPSGLWQPLCSSDPGLAFKEILVLSFLGPVPFNHGAFEA
jgi:hypothetical protein